jgi:hypothetical protein
LKLTATLLHADEANHKKQWTIQSQTTFGFFALLILSCDTVFVSWEEKHICANRVTVCDEK